MIRELIDQVAILALHVIGYAAVALAVLVVVALDLLPAALIACSVIWLLS